MAHEIFNCKRDYLKYIHQKPHPVSNWVFQQGNILASVFDAEDDCYFLTSVDGVYDAETMSQGVAFSEVLALHAHIAENRSRAAHHYPTRSF